MNTNCLKADFATFFAERFWRICHSMCIELLFNRVLKRGGSVRGVGGATPWGDSSLLGTPGTSALPGIFFGQNQKKEAKS